eukprot:1141692-Pelagomonas_calceolata.AAC.5
MRHLLSKHLRSACPSRSKQQIRCPGWSTDWAGWLVAGWLLHTTVALLSYSMRAAASIDEDWACGRLAAAYHGGLAGHIKMEWPSH